MTLADKEVDDKHGVGRLVSSAVKKQSSLVASILVVYLKYSNCIQVSTLLVVKHQLVA